MVLEPKHKNLKGPRKEEKVVKHIFSMLRHMPILRAFGLYYFQIILNW
jgi:hypothetical protein